VVTGGWHGDQVGWLLRRCLENCRHHVAGPTGTMAPSAALISGPSVPTCMSSTVVPCSLSGLRNSRLVPIALPGGGDGSASLSVLKGLSVSATSGIGRAAPALLVAAAAWLGGYASAAEPLGRLPADPGQVSVSGISSGAFMANQLHIAHSAGIMGAGIIAGGLYGCAVDSVTSDGVFSLTSLAVGPCMSVPTLLKRVAFYAQVVADLAAQGWIDPPSNLARSHVCMFTGQADQWSTSRRSNSARACTGRSVCRSRRSSSATGTCPHQVPGIPG
jgi:hypothetical protein